MTVIFGIASAAMLPEVARTVPYLFMGQGDSSMGPSRLEAAAIGAGVGAAVGLAYCLLGGCDWGAPRAAPVQRRPAAAVIVRPRSFGLNIYW